MDFKQIISIHGAPRSGTTWLGQILDSSPTVRYKFQPLFSYRFKNRINTLRDEADIKRYYSELYQTSDEFLDQIKQKEKGIHPTFSNKMEKPEYLVTKMVRHHYIVPHLLNSLKNIKFLFIVRHPCGVLKSWKNAPREFDSEKWIFQNEWEFAQSKNCFKPEEYYGYHKWKEITKLFLEMEKLYKEQALIIKYEDLVKKPFETTEEIFNFCDLEISDQTKNFIEKSTQIEQGDAYSVYKGKKDVNDWKVELDTAIVNKVYQDLKDTEFEQFL